jgi:hypothetical protein
MYTVRENTTVVGVSELRTQWKKIRQAMRSQRVEVALRNKLEAVLVLPEQLDAIEKLLDRVEDYALAIQAFEREHASKGDKYHSLEDTLKKFL